jgi:hypothetical protein
VDVAQRLAPLILILSLVCAMLQKLPATGLSWRAKFLLTSTALAARAARGMR